MPFVLDASVAACWAFDDEDHPIATSALDRLRGDEAHVPSLWWFEIRNVLVVSERRGRIAETAVARFLARLSQLPIWIDREPVDAELLGAARRHRLSAYDAAYLELASRLSAPLATLDASLAKAAAAAGAAFP
ncbi:MAG TPA: type II toxin-antitoxin system VapC family toxin [Caulobacteraceae bacterium]|nr:type II toxin-antitoxin system VapC family toxin [Caulobacteraceae bacterium]